MLLTKLLTTNIAFELQIELQIFNPIASLLNVDCDWKSGDHAGLYINFSLLKCFYFGLSFYDIRHWNDEENRWYTEEEYNSPQLITPKYLTESGWEEIADTGVWRYDNFLYNAPESTITFNGSNPPVTKNVKGRWALGVFVDCLSRTVPDLDVD